MASRKVCFFSKPILGRGIFPSEISLRGVLGILNLSSILSIKILLIKSSDLEIPSLLAPIVSNVSTNLKNPSLRVVCASA